MAKVQSNPSHGSGQTCLALSPDGRRAFTGGQDCIVRIWDLDAGTDHEPEVAPDADGGVNSVAVAHDYWISGSEDAEVRRYIKDKGQIDGLVTSAKGVPVRCVALDARGKKVAVASDELSVKLVNMEDIMQVTLLEGHTRGVRSVTWHPSGELLTTCGADGKIIAWDVTEPTAKMVKTVEGIIPTVIDSAAPEFLHDCSVVWHPSGQYLFVASRNHEIVTISRSNWSKSATYDDKDVTGAVTALAVSPNGVYMASAVQGKVHIWSTQTRRIIASHPGTPGAIITHICFSPVRNLVTWTDSDGVFFRWQDVIPGTMPSPVASSNAATATVTTKKVPESLSLFGDDNAIDRVLDGGAMDEDEGMADVDDWIIDDLGGGIADEPEGPKEANGYVKEMVSITKAQPPFQPGATPMEYKKRYLAYNMIGVIEVTDQDTHHIVNVEFFDRSMRKSYHFTDHYKYDMGCLGERGAIFACPPENDHPSQVLYKPYGTWAAQSEWTYLLKRTDTRVLGITAGAAMPTRSLRDNTNDDLQGLGNVVIATSEGDLTFLSGSGLERRILGLGGDFVSMVAAAEWVFVVHRAGSTTIDGSQNLSYSLINFDDFSVRQRDVLPIPKGHRLTWVGITNEGAPAIYDTTGRVHILTKYQIPHHGSWTRILDTNLLERRKGKDESYWPVGINGSTFLCLILKGRQEFPGFPRPLVQDIPITMPFRREDVLNEQAYRNLMFLDMAYDQLEDELTTRELSQRELAIDKEFVQLIQEACKAGNLPRVVELAKLLHFPHSIDVAIKIAEFHRCIGLKEKLLVLKASQEGEVESRLEVMKEKRDSWLKKDPPPRRIMEAESSTATRAFQNSAPPPAIHRPALAPAAIAVEHTRFSSVAPRPAAQPSWDEPPAIGSSTSSDGKRKRVEDNLESDGFDFTPPPPPKQKTNPFARKAETGRNPFARKGDPSKPVQKSESFFDKVDAAEAGKPKKTNGKAKETKEKAKKPTAQKTLDQLNGIVRQKGKAKAVSNDTQTDTQTDTQSTDITMTDALGSEATIPVDESQAATTDDQDGKWETGSVDWDETQLVETQEDDATS
ncbi:hypothetical protein EYR38_006399 [Pleurotus pulmonarius]|nr:hypothetical protein EYR38_006399 [Pleurotus pulmonarius]